MCHLELAACDASGDANSPACKHKEELQTLSLNRDKKLEDCAGNSSADCIKARTDLRIAAAEYLDAALTGKGEADELSLLDRHMVFLAAWKYAYSNDAQNGQDFADVESSLKSEAAKALLTGAKEQIASIIRDPIILGAIAFGGTGNGKTTVGESATIPKSVKINATDRDVSTYFQSNRQFWTSEPINFNGNRVYQRNDLIDPTFIDPKSGRTNLELMQSGRAPIGSDGNPINLHHMTQMQDGPIAEMTQTFHKTNSKVIHVNTNEIPSGINRTQFNSWRRTYWINRANDF